VRLRVHPDLVRLRVHSFRSVEVRAGVCQDPVAEGNCVTVRWGGEQPEANWRSAGWRTRFGGV